MSRRRKSRSLGLPSNEHAHLAMAAFNEASGSAEEAVDEARRGACNYAFDRTLMAVSEYHNGLAHRDSIEGSEPKVVDQAEREAAKRVGQAEGAFKKACMRKPTR